MLSDPGRLVIAIDGPSGSGKSSTARGVATRLGLAYLDTGAMYRAVTWLMLHDGIDPTDGPAVLARLAADLPEVSLDPAVTQVRIAGHDVTAAIREPGVSAAVSAIAGQQPVRDRLIAQQRALIAASGAGIVAEGRDITTVVAPDADLRLLLVADPAARVARRAAELADRVDRDTVAEQVVGRDRTDSATTSFTSAAPGVTVIDSTPLSLTDVIDHICRLAEQARHAPSRSRS